MSLRVILLIWILVYDLKFVGPLEFELVAPMPEQLKTTTMQIYETPRKPYQKLPAKNLAKIFPYSLYRVN